VGKVWALSGVCEHPLVIVSKRVENDLRKAINSWALVEASGVLDGGRKHFCLLEETFRPDLTPILNQILLDSTQAAILAIMRLTDVYDIERNNKNKKRSHEETLPRFAYELELLDTDRKAMSFIEKHHKNFWLLTKQEKSYCGARWSRLRSSYLRHSYTLPHNVNGKLLWKACKPFKDLRNQALAHSLETNELHRNINCLAIDVRRSLTIVSRFVRLARALSEGRKGIYGRGLTQEIKMKDTFWCAMDASFRSNKI